MELRNKTAIVTGVSKGIGKNIVLQLLDEGVRVAGLGMHEPEYQHPNFNFFKTDIRSEENVKNSMHSVISTFGEKINILINNAGLGYFGFFEEMPTEQFKEIMEVNVYSIFYTCQFIIPLMKKHESGHIINISSIAGLEGMPQVAAYCGAKHAVAGITDSLFRELRDFGIKVTGIYPGSTNTNFFDNSQGLKAHSGMLAPEEVAAQIIHTLKTPDNFLVNSIVFRPLQVSKKKK